jgi:hypothetical protein
MIKDKVVLEERLGVGSWELGYGRLPNKNVNAKVN